MLKRKRIGMLITGAIITLMFFFFATSIVLGVIASWKDLSPNDSGTTLGIIIMYSVFILLPLSVGIPLFIIGLISTIKACKYNKEKMIEGETLQTTCFHCNNVVIVDRVQFASHRRFPEGFIYCPYCSKPLSYNVFTVCNDKAPLLKTVPVQTNGPQTDQPTE